MNLKVTRQERLPSKDALEVFMGENLLELPESFINFLLHFNPISLQESEFTCDNGVFYIHGFFPFSESSDLVTFQSAFRQLFQTCFDKRFVSFGCDSGGWQYVICIDEMDFGEVFFCRMDGHLDDSLTHLADSFEEFVDGLHVPSD